MEIWRGVSFPRCRADPSSAKAQASPLTAPRGLTAVSTASAGSQHGGGHGAGAEGVAGREWPRRLLPVHGTDPVSDRSGGPGGRLQPVVRGGGVWGRAREAAEPLIAKSSSEVFNTDLALPGGRSGVGVVSGDP